jgi:hypothetical protein
LTGLPLASRGPIGGQLPKQTARIVHYLQLPFEPAQLSKKLYFAQYPPFRFLSMLSVRHIAAAALACVTVFFNVMFIEATAVGEITVYLRSTVRTPYIWKTWLKDKQSRFRQALPLDLGETAGIEWHRQEERTFDG